MKVAVLVFGEYRTFETAVKTWNCRFWDDVDYYMSTWDYSLEPTDKVKHLVTKRWKTVANEEFIKKTLPNVKLKITTVNSKDYIENDDTNKMIYHWKSLYDMVVNSGKEYDCIFLVRTDTSFLITDEFFENTKKETLYIRNKPTETSMDDIFFFGYKNIVLDFLKNLPNKFNGNPHIELKKYVDKTFENKYSWTDVGLYYELIRPTMISVFDFLDKTPLTKDTHIQDYLSNISPRILRNLQSQYDPGILKILLIGESCEDVFIYGSIDRLSPEAPIPIINPKEKNSNEGMAGNVKRQLSEILNTPDFITNNSKVIKKRYVDKSTNYILLRVDEGDEDIEKIHLDKLYNQEYDIIIFSDYDKGFVSNSDIEYIVNYYKQKNDNLLTFIDTKKNFGDWIKNIDFIKVNYKEYEKNIEYINNNDWIKEKLIVTRGPFGCDYNDKNYPNKEVPIKDLSGAGDTFLSALVAQYVVSRNIETSIEYANKISEMAVQRKGVSVITREEIEKEFNFKIL